MSLIMNEKHNNITHTTCSFRKFLSCYTKVSLNTKRRVGFCYPDFFSGEDDALSANTIELQ